MFRMWYASAKLESRTEFVENALETHQALPTHSKTHMGVARRDESHFRFVVTGLPAGWAFTGARFLGGADTSLSSSS